MPARVELVNIAVVALHPLIVFVSIAVISHQILNTLLQKFWESQMRATGHVRKDISSQEQIVTPVTHLRAPLVNTDLFVPTQMMVSVWDAR